MDPHLQFLVYLVDDRSVPEVKERLERAFGCGPLPDRIRDGRFEVTVMGMRISISPSEPRPERCVYRLEGTTAGPFKVSGMQDVSLDAHMIRVLRRVGFQRVMPRSEYIKLERERELVVVRSAEEADLYLDATPCAACGSTTFERRSRIEAVGDTLASVYEGDCGNCGAYRYFELRLDDAMPPAHTDDAIVLGNGTSRALDASQFVKLAEQIAANAPAGPAGLGRDARGRTTYQLRLAIGAIDEALKLIAGADRAALDQARAELVARLAAMRGAA